MPHAGFFLRRTASSPHTNTSLTIAFVTGSISTHNTAAPIEKVAVNVSESAPVSRLSTVRQDWKVRPGYSSGASSCGDCTSSDGEDEDYNENDNSNSGSLAHNKRERLLQHRDTMSSRHSDVLALSELREEIVAEGNLTAKMVRIEVRLLLWFCCLNVVDY